MKSMPPIAAALLLIAAGPDSQAAFANLRQHVAYEDQPYAIYLTTSAVAPEHRENLIAATQFVAASLSSKSYLPDQLGQRVEGTPLLRYDLRGLGWEKTWTTVIEKFYVPKYRPDLLKCKHCGKTHAPLVVRADFLVAVLSDPTLSGEAQSLLLYGKELKTADEFRQAWTVNGKRSFAFARVEGKSGVALQSTRVMENLPTANRSYFWQTFDSEVVAGATDPLENLATLADKAPKHDASELIAGIPKYAGPDGGSLQAYFLADGQGKAQAKAPAAIVTDTTGIRGVEIINTLGCISCHDEGLKPPTLDAYASYVLSGARVEFKEKDAQREIDRYLDSPIAKEIASANAQYAAAVKLVNGMTTKENADVFRQVVKAWHAPITIEQAAREAYTTPDHARLALADYGRTYPGQLPARLALLSEGGEISREQFEQNFGKFMEIVAIWNAKLN